MHKEHDYIKPEMMLFVFSENDVITSSVDEGERLPEINTPGGNDDGSDW